MKEKLIAIGAEKLSDILVPLCEENKALKKQLNIVFAGLDEDPQKIISILKKEIASLKKSTKFIDYDAADEFADRLNQLRSSIVSDLLPKSPTEALSLMIAFLDLHETTLSRVDDSNGVVSGAFEESCCDLGKICEQVQMPPSHIVDLVFTRFMNDRFGIYQGLIPSFKSCLKEDGFILLKERFEQSLTPKNRETVSRGLQEIADCQKDVDAYMSACAYTDTPSDYQYLEIANRLIEHWRGREALEWLEKMAASSSYGLNHVRIAFKIQALELCGEYEEAQKERLQWFEKTLSPDLYAQMLKNILPEFKESFRMFSIEKAFHFPDAHLSLGFLMQIQEFKECAKLVRLKIDELDGRHYATLRPVAKLLRDIDPLAATLIYRKLIEPVLGASQSKYYPYAAQDLLTCGQLSSKIEVWESTQVHGVYLKGLEEKHKRKQKFWSDYQVALEKQAAREAKSAAKKDKEIG